MTRQPSAQTALPCEDCGHHLHRPNPGICQWYDCGCPAVSTRRDPGQYHRDRVEREKADPEFRAEYDLARTAEPRTDLNTVRTYLIRSTEPSMGPTYDEAIAALERIGEAEAAAPAGLDVEVLRKVLDHYDVMDYHHDPHGQILKDPATSIAAEYARLLQDTEDER